jgi:D-alanine-D-alanine ligase-like ATP-grasp enzyme
MDRMKGKDKVRVGVLRGGLGEHYDSSLRRGGEIISYISENLADKYKPYDILVDREGKWHLNGVPIDPSKLLYKVDVVWNTSHHSFSSVLESFSVPCIGVPPFSKFFGNSKEILKNHIKKIGIHMPKQIIFPKSAREVFEKFGSPWIVKNFNEIKIVKTFNELAETINGQDTVIVEEFIPGKIASVHSVPMFRGENIYTFPLGNAFGIFSAEEKEKLANLAKNLHKHINAGYYLKSDFVLTPRSKVYLLQIESMPDLKKNSHFSEVCESVGAKTQHVVEHILEQAM